MQLRRLNRDGIEAMRIFLDSIEKDPSTPYPEDILESDSYSNAAGPESTLIEKRKFQNKLEAASYLSEIFVRAELHAPEHDMGLWAWVSLYYFKELVTRNRAGQFKPGARSRWIPEADNFQRYYRHLLAGPYLIYRAHRDRPDRTLALLGGKLDKMGDLFEQIASRQELVSSPEFVETVTTLYWDRETNALRRGAGGKGAGSPRRLAAIADQFDLTWDMVSLPTQKLINMLPSEFDKFKHQINPIEKQSSITG